MNKVALVTGAAGSIGRELSLQILALKPSKIVVVDFSEPNLFELKNILIQNNFHNQKIYCELGNTADEKFMQNIFIKHKPDILFHASAYKHVTLLAGNKQFELTRIEFLERFDGRISMSWRIPPNYDSPLKLYDRGPEVDWLAAKLAMIEGKQEPIETGTTFTSLLKSRVEKFQNAVGLEPDGVAGPLTLININSL